LRADELKLIPPLDSPKRMMNPLGLLPLAMAARGGSVDGVPASQLVAAGLTLLQRYAPLARALYGKRAALLLPTSPQFLVGLAASDGRGAVLLNPLAAPAELAYQLEDANVGAVFTIAALAGKLPVDLPRVLLDGAPRSATWQDGAKSLEIDLGSHVGLELEGDADGPDSEDEAAIVYTSAMQGQPLGAILTHHNLLSNARSTIVASALTAADHCFAVLPYSHLFGMTVTLSAPLLAGARVTTMGRFNPMKAVEVLIDAGVTMFVGVPAVFIGMLAAIERRGGTIAVPSLRVCICGGAALPVWVQRKWEAATGCALRQGYGLTEASPVSLFNRIDQPNRLGSLGTSYPGTEVSIRDPQTSVALPSGVTGEICVRGASVSPGYVRNGARGLRCVDGWLHSGDAGHMNADGAVTFDGLLKPMFTRNGFNVYPEELRRVIGAMPGVTQVEVRGVPEPTKENEVAVSVTGAVDEAAVRAWCAERLSSYKQPSVVRVVG
jgi:long-chain acyl-CoA synthetase